ncbi:MAG: hypothetical protein AB1640_11015 [bacterium]
MKQKLSVITGGNSPDTGREQPMEPLSPERKLYHFRNITSSMAGDALRIWSDLYAELDGTVVCGTMITADAKKGFHPRCGWPEFLERMCLLRNYLDHLKRLADTRT